MVEQKEEKKNRKTKEKRGEGGETEEGNVSKGRELKEEERWKKTGQRGHLGKVSQKRRCPQ